MTKFKVFGLALILLLGCKTKIEEFLFDASKVNHLSKYEYDYKQGKKSSRIEKIYTLKNGKIVDSTISKTFYEYNEKGLVLKEITISNLKEKPDLKLYNYDFNDSLRSNLSISPAGDTIHITKYAYFPDRMKTIFQRDMMINPNPPQKFNNSDTSLFTREYVYVHDTCKMLKEYNKQKMLSFTIEYEYKDNKVYKEIYYNYGNHYRDHYFKALDKTMYYNYSKNKIEPEYFSLDKNNDTIDFKKNEFIGGKKLNSTETFFKGDVVIKTYYKNGKEIGLIGIKKSDNYKYCYSISYYENGEVKEERSYEEKINTR